MDAFTPAARTPPSLVPPPAPPAEATATASSCSAAASPSAWPSASPSASPSPSPPSRPPPSAPPHVRHLWYWPLNRKAHEGWIIAATPRTASHCVVTVWPWDRADDLDRTVRHLRDVQPLGHAPVRVVGVCTATAQARDRCLADADASRRWHFHWTSANAVVLLATPPGERSDVATRPLVLFFRVANTRNLQYYSIQPIIFDLRRAVFSSADSPTSSVRDRAAMGGAAAAGAPGSATGPMAAVAPLSHTQAGLEFHAGPGLPNPHTVDLDADLVYINSIHALQWSLQAEPWRFRFQTAVLRGWRAFDSSAVFLVRHLLGPAIGALLMGVMRVIRMKLRGRYSLLNMSSTMQQLDLRARQALFWPAQYQQWRMNPMRLDARPQAQYIGFFNLIWLVANDVIVGIALAKFLRDHADELARALFALANRVLGHTVEEMLLWLHAWPGGIKLNAELNFFLGQLFFWMLGLWYITMKAVEPWLPTVVWWIGTSGFFGVSFSLALFSDVYTLIVVHINVFYLVAAKIYYWQRAALVSLFNLFRGKRYNILRRRVDNANYGLDQLLLGTIMFTLLAFLFPTTLVYYVCFLGFRVVSTVVHASIEALLAFVNHFPLFAIMLRFKDHRRLPGGIAIEYGMVGHDAVVKRDGTLSSPPSSPSLPLLEIHNKPISFGNIFYQYRHLLGRFQRHYFSRNTLRALIRGETFGRLSRVNYPTIPRS